MLKSVKLYNLDKACDVQSKPQNVVDLDEADFNKNHFYALILINGPNDIGVGHFL